MTGVISLFGEIFSSFDDKSKIIFFSNNEMSFFKQMIFK